MRLILPQGAIDFDTLGAMLGAFLLDEDTTALAPEAYAPQCAPLVPRYVHKFPFALPERWMNPATRKTQLLRWARLNLGVDFLQSLKVAQWLQEEQRKLDPFYASVILLGIYASTNRLTSFSVDDEVYGVVEYLIQQGADEMQVQLWLKGTHQIGLEMPKFHAMELAHLYQERIPVWLKIVQRLVYQNAWDLGMTVYLVGGVTRDLLLWRKSRDMDFIVEGSAILLGRSLESHYGGKLVTHQPFGTARWDLLDAIEKITADYPDLTDEEKSHIPVSIDLISARTEWYPEPGQLPRVRFNGIELDMQRRDFSINTLALRIEEEGYTLLDICDGLPDLDNRIIRALHPRSFVDDPTRLFRAVRYEQRLGFTIDTLTQKWMKEGLETLPVVSGDRVRHELNLMMAEPEPWKQFRRALQLDILPAVYSDWQEIKEEWQSSLNAVLHEEFPAGWDFADSLDHLKARELMGYAVLFQQMDQHQITQIGKRLMFSTAQIEQLCMFVEIAAVKDELNALKSSEFTFRLEQLHTALLYTLLVLWLDDGQLREKIISLHSDWKMRRSILDGNDLRQMQIPEGPRYGKLLQALRAAQIDGGVHTREDEIELVKRLLTAWE